MQRVLDATAVGLSALCLIHCLALPLLVAALPALSALACAEWVHVVVVAAAAPVAALAIGPVFKLRPLPWTIPALAASGLLLMLLAVTGWLGEDWETPLSAVGGIALGTAHMLNWRRAHGQICVSTRADE